MSAFEDANHAITRINAPFTGHGDVIEMWCPNVDEAKAIIGGRYICNCPMCGDEIEVPEKEETVA